MRVREATIEQELIEKLGELKYTQRPDIRDRAALEANFREKFEALNRVSLTDSELNSSGSYTASWQTIVKPSPAHVKLNTAAVLTVLGSAPPAGRSSPRSSSGRSRPWCSGS